MNEIDGIVFGAIGGAIVALSGYWKNSVGEAKEPFDYKKMLMTIVVGAVVGAGSVPQGIYTDGIGAIGGSAGIAYILESIFKGGVKEVKNVMGK
jgi:hypothetical protein